MAFNFEEFQKVIDGAHRADVIKVELKRTLKKVSTTLNQLQGLLMEMESVLADEYVVTPKERKTNRTFTKTGSSADSGAGKTKKLGRPKKISIT